MWWGRGWAGPLSGLLSVPIWKASEATEGTSLSVGKGPWNWCVFHEIEGNGVVRGMVGPLVWGSPSLSRAIRGC